ncbi:hypothetical protein Tco_1284296 [Tanacetum coccineum]
MAKTNVGIEARIRGTRSEKKSFEKLKPCGWYSSPILTLPSGTEAVVYLLKDYVTTYISTNRVKANVVGDMSLSRKSGMIAASKVLRQHQKDDVKSGLRLNTNVQVAIANTVKILFEMVRAAYLLDQSVDVFLEVPEMIGTNENVAIQPGKA